MQRCSTAYLSILWRVARVGARVVVQVGRAFLNEGFAIDAFNVRQTRLGVGVETERIGALEFIA